MSLIYINFSGKHEEQSYKRGKVASGTSEVANDAHIFRLSYVVNGVIEELKHWNIWGASWFTFIQFIFL